MGVRKLRAWVGRRYPYVILRKLRRTISYRSIQRGEALEQRTKEIRLKIAGLEIDGNALLHEAAQWVYGYGKYSKKQQGIPDSSSKEELRKRQKPSAELVGDRFIYLVEEALTLVKPSKRLYIAIDGPAPLAKAQQQRTRRFLAAARNTTENDEDAKLDIEEGEVPTSSGDFDSAMISPGTPFMDAIDERIRKWLKANTDKIPRDTVYYSHRTFGEGEHKLLDALSTGIKSKGGMMSKGGALMRKGEDEYDVVYGNDNDLIILTMVRTQFTLILRDAMDREGDIELIKNPPELGRFELIDVDVLRERLRREYSITPADLSVVLLMLGNDFVPTTPIGFDVYGTIDMALGIYRSLKEKKLKAMSGKDGETHFVLFDDKMHWNDLYPFIAEMVRGQREMEMLLRRYELEVKSQQYKTRQIESTVALHEAVSLIGGKTSINVEQYRDAYWREVFPGLETSPYQADVMLDVVDAYLEALVWSTSYYVLGVGGVNVEWYYRYHYAPMLREVSVVLEGLRNTPERWERLPLDRTGKFLNPLELEIAILPLRVLNKILYDADEFEDELLSKVFAPLRDLYPETVKIDSEGHDLVDKATVCLPFVDADRVREVAKTLGRPDIGAVERKPLVFPFEEQISGRTKTGRKIKETK